MKRKSLYIGVAALSLAGAMTSCNDLDTVPQNHYVTADQKAEAVAANPELAAAGVVGISSSYNQYCKVYDAHFDFGWPAVLLGLESMGTDLVGLEVGYNHFTNFSKYDLGNANNYINNMSWRYAYNIIFSCNALIETIGDSPEDAEAKVNAAQGFANRAYAYFTLIQLYQDTYAGSEGKAGIPLITEKNALEVANNGCGRGTVQDAYNLILSDLDTAVKLLSDAKAAGKDVQDIAEMGYTRFVSLGTAYGLRARVNLVMNNWADAAKDARSAINSTSATPYSIAEASKPAFINWSDHNVMWCIYIAENDRVVTSQIINWPSHMGSFNYGYASVGAFRLINKNLFKSIPDTDCRKGWWLDGSGQSPNISAQQANLLLNQYGGVPYVQVKFAPYQGVLNTVVNASDIMLMRVEEMYLIEAEATAMAGNPTEGKRLLKDFVNTYRDPSYDTDAASAEDLQNAVWNQRRIELWGEGLSYFDLLRLNKGLDRRGGGWPKSWVYNVPAPLKPLLIPQSEIDANILIKDSQNPTWSKPSPVADN